ncbi:MAG: phenylacetate--CoA ligase family protein [Phycisphaerae bacterium]
MIKKRGSTKTPSKSHAPQIGEHLFWPVKRWQALQLNALRRHIRHADKSRFYAGRLPYSIKTLQHLTDCVLTDKDQLAAVGDAAFACKPESVREWVTTSGTTGKPLRVPLTAADLQRLAENEAVALNIAGLCQGDTLILALALDRMFVAGLAYWLGAQKLAVACIRAGSAYAAQLDVLKSLLCGDRRNYVITVPSLLAGACSAEPGDNQSSVIQAVIGIGEPLRTAALIPNALAHRLTDTLRVPALSTYACTETCCTFAEGPKCIGGHLNPALAVVEILDDHGAPVATGTLGEVVVTPLGVQAMPLVRFRTGDIAALYTDPCPCGRTTPRLGPIVGRKRQLLKVRGSSLFPSAIFDCLSSIAEVQDYAVVAHREHDLSDRVELHVCLTRNTASIRDRLALRVRALLKVHPKITVASIAAIRQLQSTANPRKPARFIDHRTTPAKT